MISLLSLRYIFRFPQKIAIKGGKNLTACNNATSTFVVVAGTPELLASGVPIHLRDFLATGAAGQAPVVSESWLLDSIQHNHIAPENSYRVPGVCTPCASNDEYKNTGEDGHGSCSGTNISGTSTASSANVPSATASSTSVSADTCKSDTSADDNNNTNNGTNFYLFRCTSVSSRGNRNTITLRRLFWSAPIKTAENMVHAKSESIQLVFLRSSTCIFARVLF